MEILNATQMREWDAYTIVHQNITSLDLMERAARQCTGWIVERYDKKKEIQIICGKGNNGGDGLAIARLLQEEKYSVKVFIANWEEKESLDFKVNLDRLKLLKADIFFLHHPDDFLCIDKDQIIIDALFGYGLNRPVSGLFASLIDYINHLNANVISIDVPSGMFTDMSSKGNTIIKAKDTLTFEAMKLCFLLADNAEFFGTVHVLPIGLSGEFIKENETKFTWVDLKKASAFYRERKKFSHKGTYGHALLVAGNEGKVGAAVMCATSCLRSGVGLLTCSLPVNDFAIIHTTAPEAMVAERGKEKDLSKYEVIGTGPGLGKEPGTAELVHNLLQEFKKPMVIDADALNIISENKSWLEEIPNGSILSPHPKEFDRLWGESEDDCERMNKAIQAAGSHDIIIILKGTYTLVTDGKRKYFNSSGNNGLATGGSGDILTGLLTSLLAQKYTPFEAAVLGVFIHGMAADLCLANESFESLLPMDIVNYYGKTFKQLQNNKGA